MSACGIDAMIDWFARPVVHVSNAEASLRFYVDRLGFAVPRRGRDRVPMSHVFRRYTELI